MQSQEIARLGLIVVAACVFIFIIQSYNNGNNNNNNNNVNNNQVVNNVQSNDVEGFYADGEQTEDAPNAQDSGAETVTESDDEPMASEGDGNENETFKTVDQDPVLLIITKAIITKAIIIWWK